MKVLIQKQQDAWTLTALEGPLEGREIGTTEMAGLGIVKMNKDGTMTAKYLNAVYGAEYIEEVYDHPAVVRNLGINRAFEPAEQPVKYDEKNRQWIDPATGAILGFAHRVTLMHGNVFYRLKEETHTCSLPEVTDPRPYQSLIDLPKQETFFGKLKSLASRLS